MKENMIEMSGAILSRSKASFYAKKWFEIFDKDKDGKLYLDEIKSLDVLLAGLFRLRQDEDYLVKLIQILDCDQKGFITSSDFEGFILKFLCKNDVTNIRSSYISAKMTNSVVSVANSYLDLGKYGTLDSRVEEQKGSCSKVYETESGLQDNDYGCKLNLNRVADDQIFAEKKMSGSCRGGSLEIEKSSGRVNRSMIGHMEGCNQNGQPWKHKQKDYKEGEDQGLYFSKLKIASFGEFQSIVIQIWSNF